MTHVHVLSMHTSPLAQPGVGDAGGLNVYVTQLARQLVRLGHRVTLHSLLRHDEPAYTEVDGYEVRHHVIPDAEGRNKVALAELATAFAAAVFDSIDDRDQPQLVHAHYWVSGLAGMELSRALHCPLVTCLHTSALAKELHADRDQEPEPLIRVRAEHNVLARSDAVIVNTEVEAAELAELYAVDPKRLHVISPGVDVDVFTPPTADQRPNEPMTVLLAARLQPLKGPEILIDAVERLKGREIPLQAKIAGDGDPAYLLKLLERVQQADITDRVQFLPAQTRQELADLMGSVDALVMPSASETFGLIALEAQACGTPVVASAVGGLPSAVEDKATGALVPKRTPAAWADALASLAADPDKRREMGVRAAERAQQFSWENTAKATSALYQRLMASVVKR